MAPKKGSVKGDKKTTKRAKKDKSAPKRAKSAFLFFSIERRKVLVEAKPELQSKIAEVSKMLGIEWGKMNEGDKVNYEKSAKADKLRYEKEKAEYIKKNAQS
eukprot:GHVS01029377.1.p3 GENE.GHVS01029377.1~~GHVS01029377.1.p3  ORF type:complete len:102 (+),score=22.93 GHVS01029377.1:350-655(+)